MLILLACTAAAPTPSGPRVVSLHDATTELVVGLGRASDLVAVMEPAYLSPAALLAVEGLPRLAAPVSAEALLALHATVVLGTEDVPQHQPELVATPNAVWIDPNGLDGLWLAVEQVAAALDAPAAAYLAGLQAQVPLAVAGDLPVFVYDCCEPPFTMGSRAPLTELLGLMGARNVFGDLDVDWGRVSWEAVLVRQPQLVIIDDYDGEGDADVKRAVVEAHLGAVATVVLPLSVVLEGPRVLEAPALLAPAIDAARAAGAARR